MGLDSVIGRIPPFAIAMRGRHYYGAQVLDGHAVPFHRVICKWGMKK